MEAAEAAEAVAKTFSRHSWVPTCFSIELWMTSAHRYNNVHLPNKSYVVLNMLWTCFVVLRVSIEGALDNNAGSTRPLTETSSGKISKRIVKNAVKIHGICKYKAIGFIITG